ERRGGGDGEGPRAREAIDSDVGRTVAHACEPRRHGMREDAERAFTPFRGYGVAHRRAESPGPTVHDDHPLGREQRAVHEGAVARLLAVVRGQPPDAPDDPWPRDREPR